MKFVKSALAAAAVALAGLLPTSSQATLVLSIDDLSTSGPTPDVVIADNSLLDLWANGGEIRFMGNAGSWTINFVAGVGVETNTVYGLHLSTMSFSSSSGGTLRVALTETDLSYLGSGLITLTSGIGGYTTGSVDYKVYVDDNNAQFGKTTEVFSGVGSGGGFSANGATTVFVTDPFSLTLQADIVHTASSITSLDFESHIPEPTTLALLSAALIGAGAAMRRRKR